MAKRYGGKYSPSDALDVTEPTPAKRRRARGRIDPAGARANVMFIPAIPMVFMSLNDGAVGLTLAVVSAGILTAAAVLLREGLKAEAAFNDRKIAKRPAFPRKMFSSALTGLGIAIAAYKNEPGLIAPLLFGAVTAGLHVAAFGIDPLRSKGAEGIDAFQQDRVARVVEEAEKYLREMTDAILRAEDRDIERRLERFQDTAREMIHTVEDDPRDLTAARKYLGVYLMGARDATVKFADIFARSRDPQAWRSYAALLTDLEENFAAKTKSLMIEDKSDLNIEIDVLRERLQREGVRLPVSDDI